MRIPLTPATYVCSFPGFDDPGFAVDSKGSCDAAEEAATRWERDIEDFRILAGHETLRILVKRQTDESSRCWEVMGQQGRYQARLLPAEECD